MKINEVEALAGITKKNIRFYEEQGLLNPRRNPENGYRDYGDEEVQVLRRIRLLRKLDVPIDEIRLMLQGVHTVADGMRRHLITLERAQRNLQQSVQLCQELSRQDIPVTQLDTESLLARMEDLEQSGTLFRDVQTRDIKKRYVAPVAVTAVVVMVAVSICGLLLWAFYSEPEKAPPIWLVGFLMSVFVAIGIGVVAALAQRIREIQEGEIDDAKKY